MLNEDDLPSACSVRQQMYLDSEADVTLFGGAAGSGKSEIGVIDLLKYTDIPNFKAVLTRITTPQLTGAGGLLEKCHRIFAKSHSPDEYVYRAKDNKFVFKSGATVYLKHFENDAAYINWQGLESNLFYIDEGTHFNQFKVQYIMSRMRNPSCPEIKPHLKITCNPDADHFLRKWVEPYLHPDGTPDRSKDGLIRYFTFYDGDFIWGDSKEELAEKYGVNEGDCLSFTFISATVDDNPVLKELNPQYVSWLKGLKSVERARLLEGNWYVREESSSYYSRTWVREVPYVDPKEIVATVRAFDFAGTLKSDLNPSPDYTASVRMRRLRSGEYVIDDVRRIRIRHGDWKGFVLSCSEDDPMGTTYIVPEDPNPSAKKATAMFCLELNKEGLITRKEKTNKSKLDRFRPFASAAQNGGVCMLMGCSQDAENGIKNNNEFYHTELEKFTGERRYGEGGHDDMVDATASAFMALASKYTSVSGLSTSLQSTGKLLLKNNPFKFFS